LSRFPLSPKGTDLVNIPTVEHIRNILDGIAANHLFPLFRWIYQGLKTQGYLKSLAACCCSLRVLIATTFPVLASMALQVTPKPPIPNFFELCIYRQR
jgi:hypothetical protein